MRPRRCEPGVKAEAGVFTIGRVWSELFGLFSARGCTHFYLIKWSKRHYKEEIMTAGNECFVLQRHACGAIICSISGIGRFHLSLFLLFLPVNCTRMVKLSKEICSLVSSFSQSRITSTENAPVLCPAGFEVSRLIRKFRFPFFLDDSLAL